MKLSLYEIEVSQLQLVEHLIENGGELNPALEEALALNKENLQTKGVNYGFIIKQIEGECDIISKEIERLEKLKKARVKSADRLKNNIAQAMNLFGLEKIETPVLKIGFTKSKSVEIQDEKLINKKFIKTTTSDSIDKVAIKEAINKGEIVTGAILKENKNLQIK